MVLTWPLRFGFLPFFEGCWDLDGEVVAAAAAAAGCPCRGGGKRRGSDLGRKAEKSEFVCDWDADQTRTRNCLRATFGQEALTRRSSDTGNWNFKVRKCQQVLLRNPEHMVDRLECTCGHLFLVQSFPLLQGHTLVLLPFLIFRRLNAMNHFSSLPRRQDFFGGCLLLSWTPLRSGSSLSAAGHVRRSEPYNRWFVPQRFQNERQSGMKLVICSHFEREIDR